ncbi:hypothetical protein Tco_0254709, partial [Tanacetum coccineum]
MTPRSYLRWKLTGRIFKTIGLRWVPTGKIFAFSTNKVDSEPPNALICQNGFTKDEIFKMMSDHNSSDLVPQRQEMSVENVSSGLVPQGHMASDHVSSDP